MWRIHIMLHTCWLNFVTGKWAQSIYEPHFDRQGVMIYFRNMILHLIFMSLARVSTIPPPLFHPFIHFNCACASLYSTISSGALFKRLSATKIASNLPSVCQSVHTACKPITKPAKLVNETNLEASHSFVRGKSLPIRCYWIHCEIWLPRFCLASLIKTHEERSNSAH